LYFLITKKMLLKYYLPSYLGIIFVLISLCGSAYSQIPSSPFGDPLKICSNTDGITYKVNGFSSSPFRIIPFVDKFYEPPMAVPIHKVCRSDGHCIFSYEMIVRQVQLRSFDNSVAACKNFPGTWHLSYNGIVPGPTVKVPVGHESLLRFRNKINTVSGFFQGSYSPCIAANNRSGRPISVHFHGSASLAPYDGWAEDVTCFGEIKDYVYPNNRAGTGWYHDHALHITADNAYYGLAGFQISSSKIKDGGCGEPWNLEDIEEHSLVLADKVLDNKCQLKIDHFNDHEDDLYGDINLVNGVPFPEMDLEPKWVRFRILNAAVSRPYLFKIKDHRLNDISQRICRVIAADGGFRRSHIAFPNEGLYMGVAERYEIVCNFSNYGGRTIYLWNDFNKDIMKDVPYFCYSHLISRIKFTNTTSIPNPAVFNTTLTEPDPIKPLFTVLTKPDMDAALAMANADQYHREMVFGRSNGMWTINGETWDSTRVAASDVGQNTWEVWKFKTGGGWFHPVHMHLVDFFLLKRKGGVSTEINNGLRTNEILSPKDVFYLGPSEEIYVLARFGPHKGDYMFHCHNLIHEDKDMMRSMHMMNSVNTTKNPDSAKPFIINRLNNLIYNNWKYDDPMLGETGPVPSSKARTYSLRYVNQTLHKNLYRIFYPRPSDIVYMKGVPNPWQSKWCPVN
jgi:FtsP/CotA-like multicopper oxidase with cupredoxin domain